MISFLKYDMEYEMIDALVSLSNSGSVAELNLF